MFAGRVRRFLETGNPPGSAASLPCTRTGATAVVGHSSRAESRCYRGSRPALHHPPRPRPYTCRARGFHRPSTWLDVASLGRKAPSRALRSSRCCKKCLLSYVSPPTSSMGTSRTANVTTGENSDETRTSGGPTRLDEAKSSVDRQNTGFLRDSGFANDVLTANVAMLL